MDIESHMDEVVPGLYVGDWYSSTNPYRLAELGIFAVITVETRSQSPKVLREYNELGICHTQYRVGDYHTVPISDYFDHSYRFILRHLRQKKKVLVHCWAGRSRSVTIAANYILQTIYSLSADKSSFISTNEMVDKVLQLIKSRRPEAGPNHGFIRQLQNSLIQ